MSARVNAEARWLARTRIQAAGAAVKESQRQVAAMLQPLSTVGRLPRDRVSRIPLEFDACYQGPNHLGFWGLAGTASRAPTAIVLSMSGGKLQALEEGWDVGTLQLHASELRYGRRKMTLAEHLPAAGITAHALARWYERVRDASPEALKRDALDLALWTCPALIAAQRVRETEDAVVEFLIPCHSGGWAGHMVPAVVKTSNGDVYNRYVLNATTFIDNDMTSPSQDRGLAIARSEMTYRSAEAIELMLVRFTERPIEARELEHHPLAEAARIMVRQMPYDEAISVG